METIALEDIAKAIGGVLCGERARVVKGIGIDSRTIEPDYLFFALPGERTDGHRYVRMSAERGAAGAVVSQPVDAPDGFPLIYVADTVWALGCFARWYRKRFDIPVVGITGSAGKTTTKEMTAAALSTQHAVLKSLHNLNTEIGLPLTIARLEKRHTVAVLEMAMRGRGQIDWLATIARPTIGVITNIGWAHLGLLGSRENIALAKSELLHRLPENGIAVLNADDEYFDFCRRQAPCRVISFGWQRAAMVRAVKVRLDKDGKAHCLVRYGQQSAPLQVPIPGLHHLSNALAALAVAAALDVPLAEAAQGLQQMPAVDKRMQIHHTHKHITVLDDTYNANPASVSAALHTLERMANGCRRVVVLGDMLELGDEAPQLHREVGQEAARIGAQVLVAVGEMAQEVVQGAKSAGHIPVCLTFADSRAAAENVPRYLQPGDVVLVKGSRALQMEAVVKAISEDC
ncbi:MAG: UDP-N-acetylmuramoyl-tripeptide--D-alanyl-D-alanine ligase [Armatimonadota bacterium]|nr:UDP-N-acetylmuramoyl-tripeptide--D-alanyl-D-alanine ligase [bacterium]MDW8319792.1 UDP-N-acetylmuramoyl-tripeptide--D-alanyl-D-alanine ligase [Armatimonadota bacterium]